MRSFRLFSLSLCTASSLFIAGCQLKPTTPPSIQTTLLLDTQNQFQLNGKIGVRTPQQSGSAFFTWQQTGEDFELELTGMLGIGKTQISGHSGRVTLNSAKTGLIEADSPEELLQRATGWQAPITHLVDWVQARPANNHARTKQDHLGRLVQTIEDDWTVDLSYTDQDTQPNRLILKQNLANGAENRITMLIQNR